VKVVTISSWLNFGRPSPPGKGVPKFLAPPYYSQRAVFASPLSAFFISCHEIIRTAWFITNNSYETENEYIPDHIAIYVSHSPVMLLNIRDGRIYQITNPAIPTRPDFYCLAKTWHGLSIYFPLLPCLSLFSFFLVGCGVRLARTVLDFGGKSGSCYVRVSVTAALAEVCALWVFIRRDAIA